MSPPYDHYEGSSEGAAAAGKRAKSQSAALKSLKHNLHTQNDSAANEAAGEIQGEIYEHTRANGVTAQHAADGALLASGAINHFSRGITTFNGHIDDLNQQWTEAKANDFGVAVDAGHQEANSDKENEQAHKDAIDTARGLLVVRLNSKYRGYKDALDEEADYVAGLLYAGPTPQTILSLCILGDIDIPEAAESIGWNPATVKSAMQAIDFSKQARTTPEALAALTEYLLKSETWFTAVDAGKSPEVTRRVAEIVGLANARRLSMEGLDREYSKVKFRWARGTMDLERKAKPTGPLFGNLWKDTKIFGPISRIAGKIVAPLSFADGVAGLWETHEHWNGGSVDDWVNLTGNTALVVSGIAGTIIVGAEIATAAGVAGAAGVVGAPLLTATAVAAGVAALGYTAYTYRHEIGHSIEWVTGLVDDIGMPTLVNPPLAQPR